MLLDTLHFPFLTEEQLFLGLLFVQPAVENGPDYNHADSGEFGGPAL